VAVHDAAQRPIDTSVSHPARRYNYWLGGKDHFAADRASGDEIARAFPTVRMAAIENRKFLRRATGFLTREAGIRQFLDIGTGLPTAENTHEVAQAIAPESRVVYVDNDPMVMVHARALLTSTPEGRTAYLEDDLRDPGAILSRAELHQTIDLGQPVALMLVAVLHFIPGEGAANPIVKTLLDALAPGSYIVITHLTTDFAPPEEAAKYHQLQTTGRLDLWARGRDEYASFFDGLELVPPGIVATCEWRADGEPGERPTAADVAFLSGVGRIP
jgi:S-adenosyl methyltransferase